MRTSTRIALTLAALVLAGCTTLAIKKLDTLFGPATPKEYAAVTWTPAVEYERDIRPLMEKRCLACHGCYDAPCQLKLDSMQGLLRGSHTENVYALRLNAAEPARLFEDAHTTAAWRARGFHPVLNEREQTPVAHLQASVMARLLELKQDNPLPPGKHLPASFDLSLDRVQQCPAIEEIDAHMQKFPLAGMPYGLPGLSAAEHQTFTRWLALGAPTVAPQSLNLAVAQEVAHWEQLLNGDSLKHQLVARYIYEHLFLAHVYLEDAGDRSVFFKLVRSRTPPGQPIDLIATRRPYDDPGVSRVYYRLWRDPASIVAKTHLPYALSAARRENWRQWFITTDYTVTALPSYAPETASNPFITYAAIPIASRHAFLLDEAQFTVMNFIKGPVCRGNVALDVIRDRFWVFFTSPQSAALQPYSDFLSTQKKHLSLPAASESNFLSIVDWKNYAQAQRGYLQAKGDFIRDNIQYLEEAQLGTFWNGNGRNTNAALTVFRHGDSATVTQGLVGEPPLTAWLIDYPILERIHYLLVAGFDVYGSTSHQAMTRMYMDFLRMEAEMNFVAFLPQEQRKSEVAFWYRGAADSVRDYVQAYFETEVLPTPYPYRTVQPKLELYQALRARLGQALNPRHDLEKSGLPAAAVIELKKLHQIRGTAAAIIPESVIIKVQGHGLLTLLSNTAYTNISSMFGEESRRVVAEDSLTIANGVLTAYPNIYMQLAPADIPEFVQRVSALKTEADYSRLLDRFGVRRTDPNFWALSDQVLADYRRAEPVSAGVLDYNRYDNR